MKSGQKIVTVWIHGISGRVGQVLKSELEASKSFTLIGGSNQESSSENLRAGLEKADLIIDFSSSEGNQVLLDACEGLRFSKPKYILACSTGLSQAQESSWSKLSKQGVSILLAPNTSLGILMLAHTLTRLAPLVQEIGFDIEIEECHHRNKKDSPSGTALLLAEFLRKNLPRSSFVFSRQGPRKPGEIGITSQRGGGVFGEHKVRFLGDFEELSFSHKAYSRNLFTRGALSLSRWLLKQKPGFYSLNDVDLSALN